MRCHANVVLGRLAGSLRVEVGTHDLSKGGDTPQLGDPTGVGNVGLANIHAALHFRIHHQRRLTSFASVTRRLAFSKYGLHSCLEWSRSPVAIGMLVC